VKEIVSVQIQASKLRITFKDGTSFDIEWLLVGNMIGGVKEVKITRGSELLFEHTGPSHPGKNQPPQTTQADPDALEDILEYWEEAFRYFSEEYQEHRVKSNTPDAAELFLLHSPNGIRRLKQYIQEHPDHIPRKHPHES
jgi:hypothetical protein